MSFFSSVRGNLAATGRGVRRGGGTPTWVTAAGSLGFTYDSQRTSKSYSVSANPPSGETVTYSVTSGSLPTGMSLTSANGFIGGTASAVGSNTTSTFDITATSTLGGTAVRSFSIEIKAPQITSFTASGATTFSVPTGVSSVQVLVVAGGGGGGGINHHSGGGGAGGMVENNTFPVTPGGTVPVTVGAGGPAASPQANGNPGNNSVFGNITALGGGGGASYSVTGSAGLSGGNGGGGAGNTYTLGGPGTQGPSGGGTGYGTPGGAGSGPGGGGGGGGGGGAGQPGYNGGGRDSPALPNPGINWQGGKGGDGRISNITGSPVYYAGGGGGSSYEGTPGGWTFAQPLAPGGLGGGGRGGSGTSAPGDMGQGLPGQPGTGGGGGAGERNPSNSNVSGAGGTGIVIVRY